MTQQRFIELSRGGWLNAANINTSFKKSSTLFSDARLQLFRISSLSLRVLTDDSAALYGVDNRVVSSVELI
jgi:hypothetical protein